MRDWLAGCPHDRSAPTKSWAERRIRELLHEAGLPQPRSNAIFAGRERDLVWADIGIVGEIDDFVTHGDAATFESDRARDVSLTLLAVQTVRVTTLQVKHEPHKVVAVFAGAIAQRYSSSATARTAATSLSASSASL